jgi:hypothetical protein
MTEELTPEFLEFSEMLDREVPSNSSKNLSEDGHLLLELRQALRTEVASSELPADFAAATASAVQERYKALSPVRKALDHSRHHFLASAFQSRSLLRALGLMVLGGGLGYLNPAFLATYGVLLLLFAGAWQLQEHRQLSLTDGNLYAPRSHNPKFVKALFYTVPLVACLVAGVMAMGFVVLLGSVSLSFRESQSTVAWLALAVGGGVFVLFARGCFPYWKAQLARAEGRLGSALAFQLFHVGTILLVAAPLLAVGSDQNKALSAPTEVLLTAVVFLVLFAFFAAQLAAKTNGMFTEQPSLSAARRNLVGSLALGFVPIFLALMVFYQLHLTREIHDPAHRYILRDGKAWLAGQKRIPAQDNGWLLVRPFFIRTEIAKPENKVVSNRFKILGGYYNDGHESYAKFTPKEREQYRKDKVEFLSEIHRIAEVVEKPEYSHLPTEGFGFQHLVPDFVSYRAINQGLSLIVQEELSRGNTDQALDYAILGLRWGARSEPVSLIGLMIQIAQLTIAQESLEGAIVGGQFNEFQLRRLSIAIQDVLPDPTLFADSMVRESVACDQAFDDILSGEIRPKDINESGLVPWVLGALPDSYWESERRAYWNYQLSQKVTWRQLPLSRTTPTLDINPLNIASASLVPNWGRAQTQFCALHSKLSSLAVLCELELYKLQHGDYPNSLADLPIDERSELLTDLMQPPVRSKKGTFQYQRTDQGYLLTSNSWAYEEISRASKQVYGHDDHFEPNR